MKKINYYFSRGIEYGKIPASSYREGGKVKKKNDGIYLGKVIDKATGTFFNDERGFFTYDPVTGIYGPADERLTSDRIKDQRKRERILLDFGDSYFLSEVIRQMKYDTVIESIPYRNTDCTIRSASSITPVSIQMKLSQLQITIMTSLVSNAPCISIGQVINSSPDTPSR